jgi:hypothetical protein
LPLIIGFAKNITPALAIFLWLDDRLALQELLDDVASKYVPPHANIFYCFGGLVLAAFLVQGATGFAFSSVCAGWLVRSVCASVMVPALVIVLHVCRVYAWFSSQLLPQTGNILPVVAPWMHERDPPRSEWREAV